MSGCRPSTPTRPSLPVRGAWIEMVTMICKTLLTMSLPVRGAWIEITTARRPRTRARCRSPCGERGLKCDSLRCGCGCSVSLPVRGAWIEISGGSIQAHVLCSSLPVRGAWIEIRWLHRRKSTTASLPVRGAWIEMLNALQFVMYGIPRRSPCGERGLKSPFLDLKSFPVCRSPCGERGLKCP